jgi:hypothetical protein
LDISRILYQPSLGLHFQSSKKGYIKVRLYFLTHEPKHIRSFMLRAQYQAPPPYIEDVCILISQKKTHPILEAFSPAFEALKYRGWISETAVLHDFKILDEDTTTLAHVV